MGDVMPTFDELRQAFKALVWDRTSTNPSDEFAPLTPPLTDEQLAEARRLNDEANKLLWIPVVEFTCDKCEARHTCPVVFDNYNTYGDCILEK